MTRLEWGAKSPLYDRGVDQGVLYLGDSAVPWNGLVSLEEKATGEIFADHYFDGNRIHIVTESGDFEGAVSAYTYPEVFAEYNGFSERNEYQRFGLSYRTHHGADIYRIHLIYNVLVRDTTRSWSTLSDTTDPSLFNWDIYAESEPIKGASPAAHLSVDAPRLSGVLDALEDILYGTDDEDPRLPSPTELLALYEAHTILRVTYNGDGTYRIDGPDEMVKLLEDGVFSVEAPSVDLLNRDRFSISSY